MNNRINNENEFTKTTHKCITLISNIEEKKSEVLCMNLFTQRSKTQS